MNIRQKIQQLTKVLETRGYRVFKHTWGTQIFIGNDILPISPETDRELYCVLFGLAKE
jgi:hypothetical protein